LPYPGTNSGISCDGVDLDWPPDSWSYLPIASNSHDGGASGGCAPIWNVDCGCCCHDYCDSPECSSNIYSHDCHLDGDDVFFNPDAWCANTNCTDQEPSDLCIIPGDPPTWKTCDSFCDCNGLADCFSHYGGSCNSSTGNCEWTTDPSSCTPGGCNGLGDYSSGTDCAPDPCALGATSAGGVVCPIAICECDGDDGGPPCYIKHNNCIMANCACNGVEGYESGGVVWSDELGEHEVIGTYCYYPTSIYCDDEGYSACSAEGCSDWCSGNAALCDDVKCGNNTELDPTNTKFYLHTNKNCSGSTCGFDSIEECTFNYMGIEMPAGCLNGTTCSTDPCEIINIDCTKAVCNSDSTLIEYGGDCNSETGECVAMQTKICQWGCYHGEVSDGCNGPPTCLDGELLNCNLLPVDECCPAGWVGDGWGDCSQQDFGCDLSCYENSDGDPCLEPNCMDGGDCLGWHACNNPYFPYSGSWGEVGGVMSPWCDACGGASTWAYGSCCCDSFCAEFGLSCADLKDMYGLLCDGCLCPCDGDNYDSCYNVGFDDPWPGEYFPDGSSCCPWPYLKSCDRDNPMCGRVERLGDNGCDEPGLGGGHDGMDNRCYFNDGGDCD